MIEGAQYPSKAIRLQAVITALDSAVREVVEADNVVDSHVSTIKIVDTTELALPTQPADLMFLVGVEDATLVSWLSQIGIRNVRCRPTALVVKEPSPSPALRSAAHSASVTLIVVDAQAPWATMHLLVEQCFRRHRSSIVSGFGRGDSPQFDDLFHLTEFIAQNTGGLVSIEDSSESRVLAYSPSNEAADEMRVRTILGREPDHQALQAYRRSGVLDSLRTSNEVMKIPADDDLGLEPRLVSGIHGPRDLYLGSIWVQRGDKEFLPDSHSVIKGAAATAAQILIQQMQAPSIMELTVHRLFGESGGVDAQSASEQLGLDADCKSAVVGLAPDHGDEPAFLALAKLMLLHARAFSPNALIAMLNGRGYILLPESSMSSKLTQWVNQLVKRFSTLAGDQKCSLRAAIASPVNGLSSVAPAREEIDQVLDGPVEELPRVTTLEQSRTTVLLNQVRTSLRSRPELKDPRISAIASYDHDHGTGLIDSLREYFSTGGNVSRSAGRMRVHPNTLHYRLERAQKIGGLDFNDSRDRLLTALQVTVFDFEIGERTER